MDVWSVDLHRDGRSVIFGIERGIADGARLGPAGGAYDDYAWLSYAVLAWARATGVPMPFDDPESFKPDLGAFGMPTLEWIAAGNDAAVERVAAAWREFWARRYSREQLRGEEWLAATRTWGIDLIEAAASGEPR